MDTQTDPRITKLIDSLLAAGVPRFEAYAIANSIEHSLATPSYAKQCGTICVDALNTFLDRLS
jgi:hypothetical protein